MPVIPEPYPITLKRQYNTIISNTTINCVITTYLRANEVHSHDKCEALLLLLLLLSVLHMQKITPHTYAILFLSKTASRLDRLDTIEILYNWRFHPKMASFRPKKIALYSPTFWEALSQNYLFFIQRTVQLFKYR